MIKTILNKISWIEIDNKINGREITNKIIDNLDNYIFNHPRVVNSPLTNDHVIIKYHITGELKKIQKLLIQIPIRELHNYWTKPRSEGDFTVAGSESGN